MSSSSQESDNGHMLKMAFVVERKFDDAGGMPRRQVFGKVGTAARPRAGIPDDYRFASAIKKDRMPWFQYNQYLHCTNRWGAENARCQRLWADVQARCPNDWMQMWEDERPMSRFMGVQNKEQNLKKMWEAAMDEDEDDDDDE